MQGSCWDRPSDRVQKIMENYAEIFGNNYYADESDSYVQNTLDYAKIYKIDKTVPLAFFNV